MSLTSLPSALRTTVQRRAFASSPHRHASTSILFALSSLSNSRETQHFNKLTRLPRFEHSPPLKLIKQSEVDPYPLPDPPRIFARAAYPSPWVGRPHRSARYQWDEKALIAGRVILADNARREARLKLVLKRTQQRAAKNQAKAKWERSAWEKEHRKLRNEMRVAGLWILASIGTATALATWRFWPQDRPGLDSGELGRKIASRAQAAIPLPSARTLGQRVAASDVTAAPAMVNAEAGVVGAAPTAAASVHPHLAEKAENVVKPVVGALKERSMTTATWWKGLFWKQ